MPWTCSCGAPNADTARFCSHCGRPFNQAPRPLPSYQPPAGVPPGQYGMTPVQPKPTNLKMVLLIVGIVVVLLIGGGIIAMYSFVRRAVNDPGSLGSFQKSYDVGFLRSCRDAAMRRGTVSRAAADSYCECALAEVKRTHSTDKAAAACSQHLVE